MCLVDLIHGCSTCFNGSSIVLSNHQLSGKSRLPGDSVGQQLALRLNATHSNKMGVCNLDTYGLAAGHGKGPRRCQTIGVVVLWGLEQQGFSEGRAPLPGVADRYVWKLACEETP